VGLPAHAPRGLPCGPDAWLKARLPDQHGLAPSNRPFTEEESKVTLPPAAGPVAIRLAAAANVLRP